MAAAAAGVADPQVAVDELTAAGLVVRNHAPERATDDDAVVRREGREGAARAATLSFAHSLVRRLRDDLPTSELADLHRSVAAVTGGDERLRHLLAATHGADEGLVAVATARADRMVADGDPGAAARLRLAAAPAATATGRDELVLAAGSSSCRRASRSGP